MTKNRERKAEISKEPHRRWRVNNTQKRINRETHLRKGSQREAERRGARGWVEI